MNAEKLRNLFRYEPETGHLYWRESYRDRKFGKPAGCSNRGYVVIRIDGVLYQAARLIWIHQTGEYPNEVDHKDGNPSNNAWNNLRNVSRAEQLMNANRTVGQCGVRGVTFDRSRGKYVAQIQGYGRRWSKRFDTLLEAVAARKQIEAKWHGQFSVNER